MNNTLVLSDSQIKDLLNYYSSKLREVNAKIEPLLKEKGDFEDLITQLSGNEKSVISPEKRVDFSKNLFASATTVSYDTAWSIPKKVNFVFSLQNKEMSTAEIFAELEKYDSALSSNKKHITMLIAGELGDNAKVGKRYYRNGERGNYKYGLLDWKKKEEAA